MMQLASIFAAAGLFGSAAAFPALAELAKRQDGNAWAAPSGSDLRSPCPGTNTLANHGFINRDGRGITKQVYQQAFLDAFGMSFEATEGGTAGAISLCTQITGTSCEQTGFNLDMLNTPHTIEHDASMIALDADMPNNPGGDNHNFDQGVWDQTKAFFGDSPHVTIGQANTARLGRIAQAQAANTPGSFIENRGGSLTEHAFYLSTMDDPALNPPANNPDPHARLDWIDHWFSKQELPTSLGWKRPAVEISGAYINALAQAVENAPTNLPPTESTPGESTGTQPTEGSGTDDSQSGGDDNNDKASSGFGGFGDWKNLFGGKLGSWGANGGTKGQFKLPKIPWPKPDVGPKPKLVNAYTQDVSPTDWDTQIRDCSGFIKKAAQEISKLWGRPV